MGELPNIKGSIQAVVYHDEIRDTPVWRISALDDDGSILFETSGSVDLITSYRRVAESLLHNWLNTRDQLYAQEVAGTSMDTETCE